jgi:hypothetical protein
MSTFRIDSVIGKAEKVGNGTRIAIFTPITGVKVEVIHGLGRVPVDIWITDKDRVCDFCTISKDKDRAVLTFTAAKVNLYLRLE